MSDNTQKSVSVLGGFAFSADSTAALVDFAREVKAVGGLAVFQRRRVLDSALVDALLSVLDLYSRTNYADMFAQAVARFSRVGYHLNNLQINSVASHFLPRWQEENAEQLAIVSEIRRFFDENGERIELSICMRMFQQFGNEINRVVNAPREPDAVFGQDIADPALAFAEMWKKVDKGGPTVGPMDKLNPDPADSPTV